MENHRYAQCLALFINTGTFCQKQAFLSLGHNIPEFAIHIMISISTSNNNRSVLGSNLQSDFRTKIIPPCLHMPRAIHLLSEFDSVSLSLWSMSRRNNLKGRPLKHMDTSSGEHKEFRWELTWDDRGRNWRMVSAFPSVEIALAVGLMWEDLEGRYLSPKHLTCLNNCS